MKKEKEKEKEKEKKVLEILKNCNHKSYELNEMIGKYYVSEEAYIATHPDNLGEAQLKEEW